MLCGCNRSTLLLMVVLTRPQVPPAQHHIPLHSLPSATSAPGDFALCSAADAPIRCRRHNYLQRVAHSNSIGQLAELRSSRIHCMPLSVFNVCLSVRFHQFHGNICHSFFNSRCTSRARQRATRVLCPHRDRAGTASASCEVTTGPHVSSYSGLDAFCSRGGRNSECSC